jgi:hypothetical protein
MGSKATQIHAKHRDSEMMLRHQSSDSPLLPVADLERLAQIRPDLIDFVVQQTEIEAHARRAQERRINTYIFIERLFGQLAAFCLGLAGILGGIYAGIKGQPWLGGTIVTSAIGTLAVAFVVRSNTKSSHQNNEIHSSSALMDDV